MGCQRAFVRLQAVSSWQINQVTTTKRAAARQEVE
jgi:DNA-binding transcriptional regulator YdaS (Cro superfamily)